MDALKGRNPTKSFKKSNKITYEEHFERF